MAHEYRIIETYISMSEREYHLEHRLKYYNRFKDFLWGQKWMPVDKESHRECNLSKCFKSKSKCEIDDFLLWNKEQDLKMYS